MNELKLFTQEELSNKVKISRKTLESMRQKGNGPVFRKFGRRVLYAENDVIEYLQKNTFKSTSQY